MCRRGFGSMCGAPPTTSTPRSSASRNRETLEDPSRPVERKAQRRDLHVKRVPQLVPHLHERLRPAKADARTDVDMAADGCRPSHQAGAESEPRAGRDVGRLERAPVTVPGRNRFEQVSRRDREPLGRIRLIEMRVRLGGRGQQHVPAEVEPLLALDVIQRAWGADLRDHVVANSHADAGPVGEGGLFEEHQVGACRPAIPGQDRERRSPFGCSADSGSVRSRYWGPGSSPPSRPRAPSASQPSSSPGSSPPRSWG